MSGEPDARTDMQPANHTDLDPDFLEQLIDQVVAAIPAGPGSPATTRTAVRAALLALRPDDPLAAMLAAQAIAAHYAVMDGFRRAAQPDVDDKTAARLRANAAGLARMMQSSLRALAQRREAAAAEIAGRPAAGRGAPAPLRPAAPRPEMTVAERRAAVLPDAGPIGAPGRSTQGGG